MPSGAFKPYTDVKTSILYLTKVNQKNRKHQASVWHYTVKNDGYTLNTKRQKKAGENDLDTFLSFYNVENESDLLRIGFNRLNVEEIKNNDYVSIPNPYKKFNFNSNFENVSLGTLIEESKLRNHQDAEVWSVTNDKGFIPSEHKFDEKVASDNTTKYKIVLPNFFAYNPARINVGSIALNYSQDIGCVSPMYVVFRVINENQLDPKYLYLLFMSEQFKDQVKNSAYGSVRQTLNFDDFCKINIPLPTIDRQKMIVEELESYEKIINGAKQIIDNWKPYFDAGGETGKFGRWLSLEYGKSLPEKDRINGKYPVVGSNGIIGYHSEFLIESPCIIIGRKGSAGKVTLVEDNCFPIDTTFFLKWNRKEWNYIYLFYYLKTLNFSKIQQETAIPGINRNNIYKIFIAKSSLDTQNQTAERLQKEKEMIEFQKQVISTFEQKIQTVLNSLWSKV